MKLALLCLVGVMLVVVHHCSGSPKQTVLLRANLCPDECRMPENRVCGQDQTDGQTKSFSNNCTLRAHNCVHGTKYKYLSDGYCQ